MLRRETRRGQTLNVNTSIWLQAAFLRVCPRSTGSYLSVCPTNTGKVLAYVSVRPRLYLATSCVLSVCPTSTGRNLSVCPMSTGKVLAYVSVCPRILIVCWYMWFLLFSEVRWR